MKVDRWEEYQAFFQLIILRYLIVWFSLVPVIAGLVTQLPDPLPIKILNVTHNIKLSLPFHWQLLWMSSLFFVIALVIYKARCPKFIHKYNNFSDYSEYKHHPRWLVWEAHSLLKIANKEQKLKLFDRFDKKGYLTELESNIASELCKEPTVEREQTVIEFKLNDKSYKFGMPMNNGNSESEKDVFYEIFGRYSESRWLARLLIKVLLVISFVLFSIVLVQHIYNGGIFAWSWICGLFC
jgi:hypothetical protein